MELDGIKSDVYLLIAAVSLSILSLVSISAIMVFNEDSAQSRLLENNSQPSFEAESLPFPDENEIGTVEIEGSSRKKSHNSGAASAESIPQNLQIGLYYSISQAAAYSPTF